MAPAPSGVVTVRVATFNAGLAVGYVPHVTERLPHVVEALSSLDVDVLYLQEVWLPDHWDRVRDALSAKLPYVLRQEPKLRHKGGCSEDQVAPLVRCAEKHCADLRDEALATCVVRNCAGVGLSLPAPCLNCIASDTRGSLEEIVGRCIGTLPDDAAVHDTLHAYGGSFGTALFSRMPLENADELVYLSTINARGAVYARAGCHIFATHFSPSGSEQKPQVDELVRWIGEKAPRGEPAIVLGDLNITPGSSLFKRILDAGFREPDQADKRSTFGEHGWRIDHILVRDIAPRVASQRILDAPITIAGGKRTTLSDHFGVLATLEL
jgi:endonuclease/exonuclease/phosphatase family metal-dependent hydrolase